MKRHDTSTVGTMSNCSEWTRLTLPDQSFAGVDAGHVIRIVPNPLPS